MIARGSATSRTSLPHSPPFCPGRPARFGPRVLAVMGLLAVSLPGCRSAGTADEAIALVAALDIAGQAAQLVAAAVDVPDEDAAGWLAAQAAVRTGPAPGYWIESGDARAAASLVRRLPQVAGVDPLVGLELEEGVGGALAGGTPLPPLSRALTIAEPADLSRMGQALAREAGALGIHLGRIDAPPTSGGLPLAGVDDTLPERLVSLIEGAEGLPLALGIFWTPGGSGVSTWDRARLEAIEMPLLAAALDARAAALVPGALALPALSGDSTPAHRSAAVVRGTLRRDLGWHGLVIADLRGSEAADDGVGGAAITAVAAGADLVIVPGEADEVVAEIVAAVEDGRLPAGRVEAAATRVVALKLRRVPLSAAPADSFRLPLPDQGVLEIADSIARRLLGAGPATGDLLSPGTVLFTPAGRGRAFAAAVPAAAGVREVQVNLTADPGALSAMIAAEAAEASAVVYLDFPQRSGPTLSELVATLPDSLRERVPVVRVAFRRWPEAALLGERPHLLAAGIAAPAQRAAAARLFGGPDPHLAPAPPAALAGGMPGERPAAEMGMDAGRLAAVDRAVEAAIAAGTFSAAAVAVGRSGGMALFRAFGSPVPGAGPADPNTTLFDLASLTKVVGTTFLAAALVESGDLDLDAPVRRYIPEFRGEHKDDVTIRHLLAHNAGLPPGLPLYAGSSSSEEALEQVIRQSLRREPGLEAEYSDLGMIVLAEVLTRVSGKPLDHLLAQRLLVPLDMHGTMFLPPAADFGSIVPTAMRSERPFPIRGVVHDGNAYRLGGITGHAGLFSTLRDVSIFAAAMLAGGEYGGVRVLREETVREFAAIQPNAGTRALGWDTPAERSNAGRFLSARAFGHTGFTGTSIWIDPDRDLFVVLLANRTFTEATASAMLDIRIAVHEAAARAIADRPLLQRPGSR